MNAAHTSERIVIVGAGVSGLAIAVRLAQAGLPITVLEASKLGFGASTRNQGWLYSGAWFAPLQPELARMCYEALQQTLLFCPECVEPGHDGMFFLFSEMSTNFSRCSNAWQTAGIPFSQVSLEEVAQRLPGLECSEVQYAFRLPDRAIRPEILLEHLAATAQNAGAEIRTETRVAELMQQGNSIQGVVTGSGEKIRARLVVLAGNAGGAELWPVDAQRTIGQQPEYTRVSLKTHLVAVKPELARWPFCVVDAEGFNHLPHAMHSVFGTARWSTVTNWKDERVIPEEIDRLWSYATRFCREMKRDHFEAKEWAATTVQAMHMDQIEPGRVPLPTVIDHEQEPPCVQNLISVFPGRATLWPQLAEMTREVALTKVGPRSIQVRQPPWSSSHSATGLV